MQVTPGLFELGKSRLIIVAARTRCAPAYNHLAIFPPYL